MNTTHATATYGTTILQRATAVRQPTPLAYARPATSTGSRPTVTNADSLRRSATVTRSTELAYGSTRLKPEARSATIRSTHAAVKNVTGAMLSRRAMMGTLTTTSGCRAKMAAPIRDDHQRKPSSVSNRHTM